MMSQGIILIAYRFNTEKKQKKKQSSNKKFQI